MSPVTGSSRLSGQTMVCSGRGLKFGRIEIVTWLWILCGLATIVFSQQQNPFYTHGRYGKREESYAQASPFFSGSRYGRAGATSSRETKTEPKMLEVSPRVDRFFLGSRYGKRGPSINDNNKMDNLNRQQLQPPSRISSIRRFEEALGYLDRADRVVRKRDNYYEGNSNDSNKRYNEEVVPIDIPNDNELDNFW